MAKPTVKKAPRKDQQFHDYVLHDVLGELPGITSRSMFGGWGIYQRGAIFALILDGILYFKANAVTAPFFAEQGSRPFTYQRDDGKEISMAYWVVPEEVLEDRDRLQTWFDRATAVAAAPKQVKRKTTKK